MQLSRARAVRERLFTDFEFYAKSALFIRTKDQKVVPLELNAAQRRLLEAVQSQLERRGFVRLIARWEARRSSRRSSTGWSVSARRRRPSW
jgi:hypothetical protein